MRKVNLGQEDKYGKRLPRQQRKSSVHVEPTLRLLLGLDLLQD